MDVVGLDTATGEGTGVGVDVVVNPRAFVLVRVLAVLPSPSVEFEVEVEGGIEAGVEVEGREGKEDEVVDPLNTDQNES